MWCFRKILGIKWMDKLKNDRVLQLMKGRRRVRRAIGRAGWALDGANKALNLVDNACGERMERSCKEQDLKQIIKEMSLVLRDEEFGPKLFRWLATKEEWYFYRNTIVQAWKYRTRNTYYVTWPGALTAVLRVQRLTEVCCVHSEVC